ncbi:6975_t:CDS:10, partial [Cetraspora pellucida]
FGCMASVSEKNKVTTGEEETSQSTSDVEPSRMGISDAGLKQELVGRLVNECKRKEESSGDWFAKGRAVNIENEMGDIESFPNARDDGHMAGGSNFVDESLREKTPSFKQSLRFPGAKEKFMSDCDSEDSGVRNSRVREALIKAVPNLQNAAVTVPGFVFGGLNPFGAGQVSFQNGLLQSPLPEPGFLKQGGKALPVSSLGENRRFEQVKHVTCLVLDSTIIDFLAWIEMSGCGIVELQECMATIMRVYKLKDLQDPTKIMMVQSVVNSIKRTRAVDAEVKKKIDSYLKLLQNIVDLDLERKRKERVHELLDAYKEASKEFLLKWNSSRSPVFKTFANLALVLLGHRGLFSLICVQRPYHNYHVAQEWEKKHKSVSGPSIYFYQITDSSVVGINSGSFYVNRSKRNHEEDDFKNPIEQITKKEHQTKSGRKIPDYHKLTSSSSEGDDNASFNYEQLIIEEKTSAIYSTKRVEL